MSRRECGDCQECCQSFKIDDLDKDEFTRCQHQCESGCAIYDGDRPEVCREFECTWLQSALLRDDERPDMIGLVVFAWGPYFILRGRDTKPEKKTVETMLRLRRHGFPMQYAYAGLNGPCWMNGGLDRKLWWLAEEHGCQDNY